MFNASHDLADEFPEHKASIARLKQSDAHFAKLAAEYHELSRELHRIMEENETPSDSYTEQKKKRRLALKDELHALLHRAA